MEGENLDQDEGENLDQDLQRFRDRLYRLMSEDDHPTKYWSYMICMTPDTLRAVSPSSFTPRMVSIGPLHRENQNLKAFQGRKARYVTNLTARICAFTRSQEAEVLNSCMQKMKASMERIKTCYIWGKQYDDFEIAEMMVMDACFILEFVIQMSESSESCTGTFVRQQAIIYDLALLENQIPLFVLNEIFECTILKLHPSNSLVNFIHPLLKHLHLFKANIEIPNISIDNTPHILSLLHQCYIPNGDKIQSDLLSSTNYSAVDLDRAGVYFKPNNSPTWLMEINVILHGRLSSFITWSRLTLIMPVLDVHHFTELVLRNLITYEQSFHNAYYITSYVIAIDRLVNTQEDVAKLVEWGVLDNRMGSHEEAANMINNLCKEVEGLDFFYGEQWNKLNMFCNDYWPKNIAWVKRTYFRSPWNMIALIAGIILFALTIVQTLFTIMSA